jgi:zinc protease
VLAMVSLTAAGELNFSIEKHKLDNGLMVLLLEDHSCPTVTIQAWYRCGSKNERPGITGISHMFEHMMFKGSEKFPKEKFDRLIYANGGYNNAWTSFDNTTYYEVLPPDKVEIAIDLEADRSRHLLINQENLNSERQVVLSERSMRYDNSPFASLYEQLYNNAFVAHPYRWLPIGFRCDIEDYTVPELKDYYQINYAPNNSFLVIAGDFDPGKVMKMVEKYYGPIPAEEPPPPVTTVEPEQRGEKLIKYHKMAQLPAFIAGYKLPAGNSPDFFPLKVAAKVLFDGESSRMYTRLVYDEQKALFIQGSAGRLQDPGLFYVMAAANPGGDITEIQNEAWEEIDKLQNEPITERELQKAKNQLEADFIMGLQSNEDRGTEVGYFEIDTGDYMSIYNEADGIQAVTADDVMRVAKQYLTENNRTIVTLIPDMPNTPMAQTDEEAD